MLLQSLKIVFLSDSDSAPTAAPTAPVSPAKAAADAEAAAVEAARPIPTKAMPFIFLVYSIIAFVCMVNMLDGANWARWLYTVTFLLLFICLTVEFSDKFLPHVITLVARGFVIPFLFLPSANDFFRQSD